MNTVRIRTLAQRDLKPLEKLYSILYQDEEAARAQNYFKLSLNKKKAKQAFHYLQYFESESPCEIHQGNSPLHSAYL
jgi:hypothetical protein